MGSSCSRNVQTPEDLHDAATTCDLEAARRLVEEDGIDVNSRNHFGETSLFLVAGDRFLTATTAAGVVRFLISMNADVNAASMGNNRPSPLMTAMAARNLEVMSLLLDHGADINFCNRRGETALSLCVTNPYGYRTDMVHLLLRYGADVNAGSSRARENLLRYFCSQESVDVNCVQQLLEGDTTRVAGCTDSMMKDPIDKNNGNNPPIHVAASHSVELVRLLICFGANANSINNFHSTPLHIMASSNDLASEAKCDLFQVLLDANVNLFVLDDLTHSVLHCIATTPFDQTFVGLVLDHCLSNSPSIKAFQAFLLQPDKYNEQTALHHAKSTDFARAMVEQPRQGGRLLPVCYQLLVALDLNGRKPLQKFEVDQLYLNQEMGYNGTANHRLYDAVADNDAALHDATKNTVWYLRSFESIPLSVPDYERSASLGTADTRKINTQVGLRMNPALNKFQRELAAETLIQVCDEMKCADLVAYCILGYLSSLDVMRRSDC